MYQRFRLSVLRLDGIETTLAGEFGAPLPALAPRYNIAPTSRSQSCCAWDLASTPFTVIAGN